MNWLARLVKRGQAANQPTARDAPGAAAALPAAHALAATADEHVRRGNELLGSDRYDNACASYRAAVEADPRHVGAHVNLGFALLALRRAHEALQPLRRAVELDSASPDAHYLLATGLLAQRTSAPAIGHLERAIQLKPDMLVAYRDLGRALHETGQHASAKAALRAGIAVSPGFADLHLFLGNIELHEMNVGAALASYRRALEAQPDFAAAYSSMAPALLHLSDYKGAAVAARRALQLKPSMHHARSNLLMALSSDPDCPADAYLAEARLFGQMVDAEVESHRRGSATAIHPARDDRPRPLRVGLVSGDLRRHPVGYFLESVMANWVGSDMEAIAYSNHAGHDDVTARLQTRFSAWRDVSALDDEAALGLVRSDRIDVLVDLSGHTPDNRLVLFAMRAAPVQITWLGYWASTGLPAIDYVLVDPISVPLEHRGQFAEAVWYLPETRLCFTPPLDVDLPQVAVAPVLQAGHITFGSFQRLTKLNDGVLALWARVLNAVPGSRLRLQARSLSDAGVRQRLLARLSAAGVDPARVRLAEAGPRIEYLAAHAEVDILLDTFPHTGATTTCEALWMGVPTLTLAGATMLARQGASLLACAGLPEWIAIDEADYIARAVRYAGDIASLASLRTRLREQVAASAAFDASRFTQQLQGALRDMWQHKVGRSRGEADTTGAPPLETNQAPDADPDLVKQGIASLGAQDFASAVNAFRGALELAPHSAANHVNLAYALQEAGARSDAVAHLRQAVELDEQSFDAHYMLGAALELEADPKGAIDHLRRAIDLRPEFDPARIALCRLLVSVGDVAAARAAIVDAIAFNPDNADFHRCLGNVCMLDSDPSAAALSYQRTLELQPDDVETLNTLGGIFLQQRSLERAAEAYRGIISLRPDRPGGYANLGAALFEMGQLAQAVEVCREGLRVQPIATLHENLGVALQGQGAVDDAIGHFREALALEPHSINARANLASALAEAGEPALAIAEYRQAIDLRPEHLPAHSGLIYELSVFEGCSPDDYLAEVRRFDAKLKRGLLEPPTAPLPKNKQPLRVGFVSGDLYGHPVGRFLEGILHHLDSRKFSLFAYPTAVVEDELSARIRPRFAQWQSLNGLNDEAAARLIRGDAIDILIDLAGHSGRNRLAVFALRPAPVQVTWLGYFASTGVAEIDYVLADEVCVPRGSERSFTETVWRLPDTRMCYTPPEHNRTPAVATLPALARGHITFGCFQRFPKVSDPVLALWGRVFEKLPSARLLMQSHQTARAAFVHRMLQRLAAVGIAADRVHMREPADHPSYLRAYAEVDIVLDTFPYTGGTTTCEALWMGVPTLTLAGDSMVARQGAALLSAAGLSDWVADDADRFVAKAVGFAADPARLAGLRASLRGRVRGSPLFAAKSFARRLEDALIAIWRERMGEPWG